MVLENLDWETFNLENEKEIICKAINEKENAEFLRINDLKKFTKAQIDLLRATPELIPDAEDFIISNHKMLLSKMNLLSDKYKDNNLKTLMSYVYSGISFALDYKIYKSSDIEEKLQLHEEKTEILKSALSSILDIDKNIQRKINIEFEIAKNFVKISKLEGVAQNLQNQVEFLKKAYKSFDEIEKKYNKDTSFYKSKNTSELHKLTKSFNWLEISLRNKFKTIHSTIFNDLEYSEKSFNLKEYRNIMCKVYEIKSDFEFDSFISVFKMEYDLIENHIRNLIYSEGKKSEISKLNKRLDDIKFTEYKVTKNIESVKCVIFNLFNYLKNEYVKNIYNERLYRIKSFLSKNTLLAKEIDLYQLIQTLDSEKKEIIYLKKTDSIIELLDFNKKENREVIKNIYFNKYRFIEEKLERIDKENDYDIVEISKYSKTLDEINIKLFKITNDRLFVDKIIKLHFEFITYLIKYPDIIHDRVIVERTDRMKSYILKLNISSDIDIPKIIENLENLSGLIKNDSFRKNIWLLQEICFTQFHATKNPKYIYNILEIEKIINPSEYYVLPDNLKKSKNITEKIIELLKVKSK